MKKGLFGSWFLEFPTEDQGLQLDADDHGEGYTGEHTAHLMNRKREKIWVPQS